MKRNLNSALIFSSFLCLMVVGVAQNIPTVTMNRHINYGTSGPTAALLPWQRATLTTPTTVGQVKVVDVSDIVLVFTYNTTANEYKLDEIRIAAHEGEIVADGLPGERFVRHGGEGFTIKAADLPAAAVTNINNIKDRAVRAYLVKKGITATIQ